MIVMCVETKNRSFYSVAIRFIKIPYCFFSS